MSSLPTIYLILNALVGILVIGGIFSGFVLILNAIRDYSSSSLLSGIVLMIASFVVSGYVWFLNQEVIDERTKHSHVVKLYESVDDAYEDTFFSKKELDTYEEIGILIKKDILDIVLALEDNSESKQALHRYEQMQKALALYVETGETRNTIKKLP